MERIRGILRRYWGFTEFRPLQARAMQAVLAGRDSLVVLPTGGGKSLCFQAPALALPGLAVVVSPLVSLMKDQVDALADCGVPAAAVSSQSTPDERRRAAADARSGRLKLLYMSPERLMMDGTLRYLASLPLSLVAIDEAHCISEWGHDFRPEYRELRRLKEVFPTIAVHAYTATATERVRADIVRELALDRPEILVGSFDRPNLVYRVHRRGDLLTQVREVIDRHADDSGIVYCIRRDDVDGLCEKLQGLGYSALPYHAGMADERRRANQEAFINDAARIIVATVAFGMGIDKSDVRYVIHAAAPKSLESYQQESGRAGRDGLEAECWLFHSGRDFATWRRFHDDLTPAAAQAAQHVLAGMERFCSGAACRHRTILEYFGQSYPDEPCNACDICLDEVELVDEPLVLAQKILSCVLRLRESFGADYTAQVLAGSREQRIVDNQHDQLSTWGLLAAHDKRTIRDWIEQLLGQDLLARQGEFNVLAVTPAGRSVLRGEGAPRLLKPAEPAGRGKRAGREARVDRESWEGVDRGLFEALRVLRRKKSSERGLPPFVVFSDATLRDLARRRPSTPERMLAAHGVGEKKLAEYGAEFLEEIRRYCQQRNVGLDAPAA